MSIILNIEVFVSEGLILKLHMGMHLRPLVFVEIITMATYPV